MLERKLSRLIRTGRLTIAGLRRDPLVFGSPTADAPRLDVVVRVKDRLTAAKIALRPGLYFGEAYMDGSLVLERGTLWDLLELCRRNFGSSSWGSVPEPVLRTAGTLARRVHQMNSRRRAQTNVAHHYDLSDTLLRHFLDSQRQYSCGYFRSPGDTLDQAQAAKMDHIAAKLLLRPGLRVLDIGYGWGGLALHLARTAGVHVTGITLSQEQARFASQRIESEGMQDDVNIAVRDFRQVKDKYDRIVSVGMFEHVGVPYYQQFFDTLVHLLTDDGVALVHSIGRSNGPGMTDTWTRKYIFPGGYVPALSEVLPRVEQSGRWITDIEILRLHYAETLRHWRERFLNNRAAVRDAYDDRFCRMWEFFLATSEMAFRYDNLMVFQMQLSRSRDAVPLTRDYMLAAETQIRSTAPHGQRMHAGTGKRPVE